MNFNNIETYTRYANYCVDVPLGYLQEQLKQFVQSYGCNLNPDFQRPYVWTVQQQTRFVEHLLKGGKTGTDILFNCPNWQRSNKLGDFVLVDGKQRLEALRRFFTNEIKAFGTYYKEFEGHISLCCRLKFHVNDLKTRKEVLQWYLDFNTGGTVHTEEEISRVKALLEAENQK